MDKTNHDNYLNSYWD